MYQSSISKFTNILGIKWAHITTFNDIQCKLKEYQQKWKYKKQIKLYFSSKGKEYRAETKVLVSPWIAHIAAETQNRACRRVLFLCVPLHPVDWVESSLNITWGNSWS